jgi:2-methylcitrate dehydratase PrpD
VSPPNQPDLPLDQPSAIPLSAARVGEIVESMSWETFPSGVRHRARLALRDTLGVMLGGCDTLAARTAAAACRRDGGSGPVEVLASGIRTSRMAGALANAVAASSLDFDDGHVLGGSVHPGAAIVPAVLATGAGIEVTIRQALEAVVLAYEVAIRAGYLLWPPDRSHQAHLAGAPAAIGGAVGCGKLLGLPADGIRRALEIGWAHAPIARLQFPMVKESLGWAGACAVGSALLAAAGFKDAGGTPPFAQEAHPPTGFDLPAAQSDDFVSSLGAAWEIENAYFKPYAACRFTHTAADAVKQLGEQHAPAPEDIVRIVVSTHREAAYLSGQKPSTIEEAQYSFPWVVAAVMLEGEAGPAQMSESRLTDKDLLNIASRVVVEHDRNLDDAYPAAYPSRVTVHLADGEVIERQVDNAYGTRDRPMSDTDLERKFASLAEPRLGPRSFALSQLVMTGEDESLERVLDLLKPPGEQAL